MGKRIKKEEKPTKEPKKIKAKNLKEDKKEDKKIFKIIAKEKEKEKKTKKEPEPDPKKEDEKICNVISKGGAVVDMYVPNSQDYHVVLDQYNQFNGKSFSATLNESNLEENANKFYILQILEEDKTGNYFLFTRWGRVGVPGVNKLEPMLNLPMAMRSFIKKYNEKIKKKYTEIGIDFEEKNNNTNNTPKDIKSNTNTTSAPILDKYVSEFISLIFNMSIMNNQMTEIGYDVNKMPLGKLSSSTLNEGYNILLEIEKELLNKNFDKEKLKNLSSNFYTLIPHNFGFKKMINFIIDTTEKLKEKIDLIETLKNLTVTTKILNEEDNDIKNDENKLLYSHYKKLHCSIRHIEPSESIYNLLKNYLQIKSEYIYNKINLLEAFEIEREGEKENFNNKIGNKFLLWHGSRITNFVGILSQGLKIAPPEAPHTGYLFGKGLYFADMSDKSCGYCHPHNGIGYILLAEVALGKIDERMYTDSYLPSTLQKGCNSVKGLGNLSPTEGEFIEDKIYVPNKTIKFYEKVSLLI